jgi:D-beta-D-heptose 7-phosphate kinase/D-beta-D-heptose 1-phosphate adenosyltransferase
MDAHLIPLIEKLADQRALVIGDVMLDRFVYGQVERISPEAPIPVLHIQRESVTLGGAGNVVRNLISLGGVADLIGAIGEDQAGYDFAQHLAALPQVTSYVFSDKARPTTLKTRYIANSQQMLRTDNEVAQPLSATMEQQVILRVKSTIKHCGIVIMSDYAKGVLTPTVIAETIKLAKEAGRKVLVDPKNRDFSRYKGATILTPNRKELAEASGMAIRNPEDAERAAKKLCDMHQLGGMLVKLGGDGVCLVMQGQETKYFRISTREVFDVSGAGDTVMATFALALAAGVDAADAAVLSNVAGSIVVAKVGTACVTREELARELTQEKTRATEAKIATFSQASDFAEAWRKQGLKVGFTNGCFDLLHPGHISLVRQARAACDRLIVGLNTDASVRRLKGEDRPVQNETARSVVLASLADVDLVVLFDQDTPVELIKAVHPDVLVKGADYTVDTVVGADLVQSWGGKIVLAKLVEGQSTTATISKLSPAKKASAN